MSLGFLLSYYLANALYDRAIQILITGAIFNSWIAFFNLIPFMGLDGSKIFSWSKLVWVLTFALAIALYVIGDIAGGRGLFGLFR
jgi:Zn-dependent protease